MNVCFVDVFARARACASRPPRLLPATARSPCGNGSSLPAGRWRDSKPSGTRCTAWQHPAATAAAGAAHCRRRGPSAAYPLLFPTVTRSQQATPDPSHRRRRRRQNQHGWRQCRTGTSRAAADDGDGGNGEGREGGGRCVYLREKGGGGGEAKKTTASNKAQL